jgi:hypothetical protein
MKMWGTKQGEGELGRSRELSVSDLVGIRDLDAWLRGTFKLGTVFMSIIVYLL